MTCAQLAAHQGLRVEVGVVLPFSLVLRRPLVFEHRVRVDAAEIHHLQKCILYLNTQEWKTRVIEGTCQTCSVPGSISVSRV